MQWRNIEYSVVQTIGKLRWKWRVDISSRSVLTHGEAHSRTLAIAAAIAAIEKSVSQQSRFSQPEQAHPANSKEHHFYATHKF